MKKLTAILIALTVLFSAAAFADDLSGLTDEELYALHHDVLDEMARRGLSGDPEGDLITSEIMPRMLLFFSSWSQNLTEDMLAVCDSGWKETVEDPREELVRILDGRTPSDMVIEAADAIAGEVPDGLTYYLVTLTSHLGRDDGMGPENCRFRLIVRKEDDGQWYINPTGLETFEPAEEETPEEAGTDVHADADTADTFLYYAPEGGEYYHLDPNCRRVNPKYLPLQGIFALSEVNEEPYCNLKPCEICGAPTAPERQAR